MPKIQCTKCKKVKLVRRSVLEVRIKKFSGEDELKKKYLCQKCRPKTEVVKPVKAKKEKKAKKVKPEAKPKAEPEVTEM